ncbi:TPA: hypothetical protein HA235_04315 [Candidatus Woesearchaeota archaeon]|nr:hypothetical protein [uncultured archaeon]MBS3173003.1 hypothetical protein [Candidatus Woesearchaeota archaeon]AQS34608.1 hypothetical protein [uncultured archaeon]HIH31907.1 hypothetical protein [Candidatus Woesearchaeota archaeon]HIH54342.1 hypothetical protein [Candidatus Woesearchaeota archaeon]
MNPVVKKNLLDLEFNSYLQYFNTTIIILATYIVGLSLAIITQKINYTPFINQAIISAVTAFFVGISVFALLHFKYKKQEAKNKIKRIG